MSEENLIFIISQPRAGSTMLQAILSNNNQVDTVSEPWLLLPFLSIFNPEVNTSVYNGMSLKKTLSDFLNKKDLYNGFHKGLKDFILKIYSDCKDPKSRYFLDKTPRYYEIANEIVKYFPKAKIIVLKRNPLDVIKSIIKTWKVDSYEGLFLYHRDILFAPFIINEFLEQQKSNQNVVSVFYEDLVGQNNWEHYQKLYEWLDIPFDKNNLDYSDNQKYKGVFGDPVNVQKMKNPINSQNDNSVSTNFFWNNFLKGYYSFLGADFLSNYMRNHFSPIDSNFNIRKSKFRQMFYNITGREKQQLDFIQFRYGVDNGIFMSNKQAYNSPSLKSLWRHL